MTRRLGVTAAALVAVVAVSAWTAPSPAAVHDHAAPTSGPPTPAQRVSTVRASGSAPGWQPKPGLRWQYQLQGAANTSICATPAKGGACVRPDVFVFDLYQDDGVTLNYAAVDRVHRRGAHAVCYVDAGTWENWRPDAENYPARILGKSNGWPGERWVDIRATKVLLPILEARVHYCRKARFDALDFDNVDGFANRTGFPLTAAQQLSFNRALARIAHEHGLAVGLKNDLGQAAALRADFNFAVNEQCFAFHECSAYDSWTKTGRAVVEIEYAANTAAMCAAATGRRRVAIHKALALKATPWVPCR